MNATRKVKLKELTGNLTCYLCKGYYIDASTIVECLHSFCRTCIVQHLENSEFCPVCDVQLHSSQPLLSVRPDQMLQEIVYKLVPGLYQNEMGRRRTFYNQNPNSKPICGEDSGRGVSDAYISSDDQIHLSLEYQTNDPGLREKTKRYITCPAAVSISILKKLIHGKYDLCTDANLRVNLMYGDRVLPDDFLLMDIAYKYSWTKTSGKPLKLSFSVHAETCPNQPPAIPTQIEINKQQCSRSATNENNNAVNLSNLDTPTQLKRSAKRESDVLTPQLQNCGKPQQPQRKRKLRFWDSMTEDKLITVQPQLPHCENEVQLRISEAGVISAKAVNGDEKIILNSLASPVNGIEEIVSMLLQGTCTNE